MNEGPPVMEPEASGANETPAFEGAETVESPEQNFTQTETAGAFVEQETGSTATGNSSESAEPVVVAAESGADVPPSPEQKPESFTDSTDNTSRESVVLNVDAREKQEAREEQMRSVRDELEKLSSSVAVEAPTPVPQGERMKKESPLQHSFETYIKYRPCELCRGSGRKFFIFKCPKCKGSGSVVASRSDTINTYQVTKPVAQAAPAGVVSSVPTPEQVSRVESGTITTNTYEGPAEKATVKPEEAPRPAQEQETWTTNTYEGTDAPRTVDLGASETPTVQEQETYTDNSSHETSETTVDASGGSEAPK